MTQPSARYFLELADRLIKGDILPRDFVAEIWQKALDDEKREESAMSGSAIPPTFDCWLCAQTFPEDSAQRLTLYHRHNKTFIDVFVCQSCSDEIFKTKKEEKLDAITEA